MARKKSKKKSFSTKFTVFIVILGVLFALAQYFYPTQVEQVKNKVSELVSEYTPQPKSDDIVYLANSDEIAVGNYLPAATQKVQILKNIGYISAFSNDLGVPLWVAYVAQYPFKFNTVSRPSSFTRDSRASGSAEHKDYSNSGYDRGHMAPNYVIGMCYGEQAQMETFLLTNIVPQKANMNRGIWKDIEQYISNDLAKKYGKVLVFIGPIFEQPIQRIKGKIAIPSACYAILMTKGSDNAIYAMGFIVPQAPTKKYIWDYSVPIDEIERLTGIDFLPQLPDELENKIEARNDIVPFKVK